MGSRVTAFEGLDVAAREMVLDDVDAVASLEAQVASDGWSRELFASEFEVDPRSRYWLVVADSNGRVVAFGGVMITLDEAHIMNLAVDPEYQRRRVATTILEGLLGTVSDRGAVSVTLEVRASNTSALALYEALGFVSEGNRPNYYPDGEAATIMWVRNLPRMLRERAQA